MTQVGRDMLARIGAWLQPKPPPGLVRVRERPSIDFSLTGLIYCCMMLFMGLAAINSQANLLFGVFGLMVGTLIVSGFICRLVLKRLEVRRVIPRHGVVGRTLRIVYEITNRKRFWPSLSVSVAELDGAEAFSAQPQCYMLHAAAGVTAAVPAEVMPRRRGIYEFDRYQLATSFPFGFIKRALNDRRKDVVEIFPALAEVDPRLLALCRSAETSGSMMRPRPGGMDEFYGVKDFRYGDSPRSIYWRRSARTGHLVAKEMTQVAPPRLLLLVDTGLPERNVEVHARCERTIAMAASLADKALADGLSVGLCVWSKEWVAIPPGRGKNHREDLLSVLARLPLNTAHTTPQLLERCQSLLKSGTTPVLLTPHDMRLGLIERARGGMVVVSAVHASADAWFRFDPPVDFSTAMPPDQQPPPTMEGVKPDPPGSESDARSGGNGNPKNQSGDQPSATRTADQPQPVGGGSSPL